ncbi:3-isopropylmalate dehydratase large subunit [Mycolicibacterium novocastrense]|nr:3-isopropylmalate dehydratase large subunit [Mycolicibacterium novocastrense]
MSTDVSSAARGPGDTPRTLAEKVWADHVVVEGGGEGAAREPDLIYIDLHLVHEVTSPQAFDGLRLAGRPVRRPDLTIATEDHNVPTIDIDKPIADPVSRTQVETLRRNCEEFGIRLHPMGDAEQGIVHIIGPQLGLTQPGMTVVCGDSHTSTHGAFGALAMGIGTSEVEHVLATQTLPLRPFKTMAVNVDGELPDGVSAKDIILAVIAKIGTGGGQGPRHRIPRQRHRIAVDGRSDDDLQHEHRGGCAGRHGGTGRHHVRVPARASTRPQGEQWDQAVAAWRSLRTDEGAEFDTEVYIDASTLSPFVTWGTNPGQGVPLSDSVPDPELMFDEGERQAAEKALAYMDLRPGTAMRDISVDTVFVGSCTNGRIEDLRVTADVLRGRKVADGVRMLIVPGSMRVRLQAESEGLGEIFTAAGAEWRQAGCSMCLGMNPDQLSPGQRCASTSNRNFEGRQGKGGRTHLVSPAVAAATAVRGTLSSPADLTD